MAPHTPEDGTVGPPLPARPKFRARNFAHPGAVEARRLRHFHVRAPNMAVVKRFEANLFAADGWLLDPHGQPGSGDCRGLAAGTDLPPSADSSGAPPQIDPSVRRLGVSCLGPETHFAALASQFELPNHPMVVAKEASLPGDHLLDAHGQFRSWRH